MSSKIKSAARQLAAGPADEFSSALEALSANRHKQRNPSLSLETGLTSNRHSVHSRPTEFSIARCLQVRRTEQSEEERLGFKVHGDGVGGEDPGAGWILPTRSHPRVPVPVPFPFHTPRRAAALQAAAACPAAGTGGGGRLRGGDRRQAELAPWRDLLPLRPPLAPLLHRRRYSFSLTHTRTHE